MQLLEPMFSEATTVGAGRGGEDVCQLLTVLANPLVRTSHVAPIQEQLGVSAGTRLSGEHSVCHRNSTEDAQKAA